MRAITLWQPWASWVIDGFKTIETRRHRRLFGLKGERIAIHAGCTFDRTACWRARKNVGLAIWYDLIMKYHAPDSWRQRLPRGAILGTVDVVDVAELVGTPSSNAAALCDTYALYGLFLARVDRFDTPIPAKGHQGIWEWEGEKDGG